MGFLAPFHISLFCGLLGYEHYKTMRADPSLCFLSKVGPPNNMNDSTAGDPTDPDDRQVLSILVLTKIQLHTTLINADTLI